MTNEKKKLKKSFSGAILALLIAVFAVGAATFAWYIYNTGAHTTTMKMAAGSTSSLYISKDEAGPYGSSALLASETGRLQPVSTNKITGGFQEVTTFENMTDVTGASVSVAKQFGVTTKYYYKQTVYLCAGNNDLDVYIADIGYTDCTLFGGDETENPISAAIRVGFVIDNGPEYVFAINTKKLQHRQYNTKDKFGEDTSVTENRALAWDKTDGTTVEFVPLTEDNMCLYNSETGVASKKANSKSICTCKKGNGNQYGTPVQVDMYIWLEGCDPDCTTEVNNKSLRDISVQFSGIPVE